MSKTGIVAAMIFTLAMPHATVFAAEKSTKYEATYKKQDSIENIVETVFDQDLKSFNKKVLSDKVIFTSKNTEIEVSGFDASSVGQQNVQMKLKYTPDIFKLNLSETAKRFILQQEKEIEENVVVDVKDSVKPTIEADSVYRTEVGSELDLKKKIKTSDNHNVESFSIEGDIDYEKEGTYEVQAVAKDASGNTTTKSIQVEVENFYQKIADAALAQLGVTQDCTMLVTNALKAVGINFHGAPEDYLSLGTLTDHPVPGDICVYHGHVALYIGNGKAVHGGWLGNQTVVNTVECDRQFIGYVHVAH